MVKVENKDTLRLLTSRFMKMNRTRNIIAVIAIMLTSLLFTSLLAGSESLILSKRASEIRQIMCSSHVFIENLTDSEATAALSAIRQSREIDRYGTGIFLGAANSEKLAFSTEVRSADTNLAESFNAAPTTGRMPQHTNEAAVSTLILDAFGIPHKIGEQITITWERDPVYQEVQTDTFTICGYWEGDKSILSQLFWVSPDFAEANRCPATKENLKNGIYNGSIDYCIWYHNLWHLSEKTNALSAAAGFTGTTAFAVNPAYNLFEEDSFSFGFAAVLILFIMLAGYLIIYNIFSISVRNDIRAYALLKNVGTTGKQLKKIVRMQALRLSIIGIIPGLFAGYLYSMLIAPSLTAELAAGAQTDNTSDTMIAAHPLLFVCAALFTLFTVYLSSLQACRMVEKVSPVEALSLAQTDRNSRPGRYRAPLTWYGMAVWNVLRNWKRGLVVMLSIALSLVVVNSIFILVTGYDFDSYRKIFLASDFQLDQMTSYLPTANFYSITPEIRETLENCPYDTNNGYVYYSPETHQMEARLTQIWNQFADSSKANWSDYEKELWNKIQTSGQIPVHFLGISQTIFDKLEWRGEPCSWETFAGGDTVIVGYNDWYFSEPVSYYEPDDTFCMQYQSGAQKTYHVLGEAVMPYCLDYPYADFIYLTVLVPENEFIRYTQKDCAMYAAIDADRGTQKQVLTYLQEHVLKNNDMLNLFSILDMQKSFRRYLSKYYIIGGFLVIVLGLIGIMNFFNMTATSILSRKRELALLKVVGMTRRQLIQMLVAESILYLVGAFAIAVLLVCTATEQLLASTVGIAFFFQMHLTILPCIVLLPLLLVIAVAIPRWQFEKMEQESMVERIK